MVQNTTVSSAATGAIGANEKDSALLASLTGRSGAVGGGKGSGMITIKQIV